MLTTTKSRLNQFGRGAGGCARNQNARPSQAAKNAPAAKSICPRKLSAPGRGTTVMAKSPRMARKLINAQISGRINSALIRSRHLSFGAASGSASRGLYSHVLGNRFKNSFEVSSISEFRLRTSSHSPANSTLKRIIWTL